MLLIKTNLRFTCIRVKFFLQGRPCWASPQINCYRNPATSCMPYRFAGLSLSHFTGRQHALNATAYCMMPFYYICRQQHIIPEDDKGNKST